MVPSKRYSQKTRRLRTQTPSQRIITWRHLSHKWILYDAVCLLPSEHPHPWRGETHAATRTSATPCINQHSIMPVWTASPLKRPPVSCHGSRGWERIFELRYGCLAPNQRRALKHSLPLPGHMSCCKPQPVTKQTVAQTHNTFIGRGGDESRLGQARLNWSWQHPCH